MASLFITLTAISARAEAPAYVNPPVEVKKTAEEMIADYEWPLEEALLIAKCESNLNPEAHNSIYPDNSWGIFQINIQGELSKERPSPEWLVIPENNIEYAYSLWKEQGWRPWLNCAKKHNLI